MGSIPVMAKCRIGHFVEAQILQQLGVDCIDESEVLTVADEGNHVNKTKFKVPFVCGCRNLGEALRRVAEGCSMIRTKGEAVTHFNDPKVLAEVSEDIGDAMTGINCDDLVVRYAGREGGNMEPAAKKAKLA